MKSRHVRRYALAAGPFSHSSPAAGVARRHTTPTTVARRRPGARRPCTRTSAASNFNVRAGRSSFTNVDFPPAGHSRRHHELAR